MVVNHSSRNRCLDFLKGIACIGIIFIHIRFPGTTGKVVLNLFQFAVPLFFMIAGYYAFDKDCSVIKKRMTKILKLFIIAYLIYFIRYFGFSMFESKGVEWLVLNYNWHTISNMIVFCWPSPIPIHLWYLIAMLEIYILWYNVVKYRKENRFIPFIPMLFLLQIFLTIYCEVHKLGLQYEINFITRGLPFFLTGYVIHSNEKMCAQIKNSRLLAIIFLSLLIILFLNVMLSNINYASPFVILYSIAIFILGVNNSECGFSRIFEYIGDKLSLNIYIFHILVSSIWGMMVAHLHFIEETSTFHQWIKPLVVVVGSIVFALFVNMLKRLIKMLTQQIFQNNGDEK